MANKTYAVVKTLCRKEPTRKTEQVEGKEKVTVTADIVGYSIAEVIDGVPNLAKVKHFKTAMAAVFIAKYGVEDPETKQRRIDNARIAFAAKSEDAHLQGVGCSLKDQNFIEVIFENGVLKAEYQAAFGDVKAPSTRGTGNGTSKPKGLNETNQAKLGKLLEQAKEMKF